MLHVGGGSGGQAAGTIRQTQAGTQYILLAGRQAENHAKAYLDDQRVWESPIPTPLHIARDIEEIGNVQDRAGWSCASDCPYPCRSDLSALLTPCIAVCSVPPGMATQDRPIDCTLKSKAIGIKNCCHVMLQTTIDAREKITSCNIKHGGCGWRQRSILRRLPCHCCRLPAGARCVATAAVGAASTS